ncbi:drug resistance transporter, EmrB/QacA subfamily [Xylanimonas cellulosilytica DSM 15894]|uniref:Drug resistance transporter, EmrB/QacA subfamily n=1 Tax=Xylanimonas cellulosilytica (strain DSM 15894 / JCM 12276 / CECT 5975 / KCTC 9989 / LMG 20990 / NBRC 107835 / XIL07) TaxID=446471 RepID=D1BUU4_XYLCX|nr:MDR family MFS transporter [Xylanimonas cellulosilytica]ACZ29335.1 drug resistance transporter, EmrB/QacA subfamily [Xylanimonas cellulosilytica DSM 15894]
MSTTTATAPTSAAGMTHRETLEALSGIILGMFVALLAATITSSSMPRIVSDLGGSQSSYTWVVTATLLAQTVSTPLWGKFADLFGRKLLVQIALVITVLSAAAAGFSQDIGTLIACRAVQGLGAGGLMALATILIADIVSPRERGRYMGLMGGVMAVSQVGGPLLGGVLTDSIGWRWNFFVGVPFAIAAIIVLQKTLHLPARPRRVAKIDYWGAALISLGVSLVLVWVTFAGNQFAWASWQTGVMVGAAVVALVAAVLVERVVDEPVIPLHLFKNRTFVLAVVGSIAVGVAMFGTAVFLSQYLQISRGKTPTESGLLTIPMVVGTMLAGVVLGRIISITGRYKGIMVGGGVVLIASLLGMSTIDSHTSFWLIGTYLFGLGISVGALMQNLVLAVQNTLDVKEMGAGTSTVAFFRSLGGAVGVSALGAVLASTVKSDIVHGLSKLGVSTDAMGVGGTVPNIATLPAPIAHVVQDAYSDGISELFLIAVPMAVIALVCVIFLKEVPLGQRSGIQQMLEENAAEQDAEPALASH